MWSRRLLALGVGLLAGFLDATVIPWLPGVGSALPLSLCVAMLLAAFSTQERALTAAMSAGLVIDTLQPTMGLVTIRLIAIVLLLGLVANVYVANRSFFGSMALSVMGVLVDHVLLWLMRFVAGLLGGGRGAWEVPLPLMSEIVWVAIMTALTFVAFAAFTRRFMPLLTRR